MEEPALTRIFKAELLKLPGIAHLELIDANGTHTAIVSKPFSKHLLKNLPSA